MRQLMRRAAILLMVLSALVAPPRVASAQTSPVADLLLRAHGALDNLRYAEADSIVSMMLRALGDRLTKAERLQALEIAAAALYPDPAGGGVQRRDTALALLRQVVRLSPGGTLLQDLSWAGLDTLFRVAQRTTFAAGAHASESSVLTGSSGRLEVPVFATRPAAFVATFAPAAGGAIAAYDSVGCTDRATLGLRTAAEAWPLAAGAYVLRIVARDSAAADSVVLVYDAVVAGPPVELTPLPMALDSTRLRPEVEAPARTRGVVAGLLLGGGTLLAVALKGPAPLSGGSADSRGIAIGLGLAAGAVIGGLIDHERPAVENIAANAQLRRAFDESVAAARAERQRRLDALRLTVTLTERR